MKDSDRRLTLESEILEVVSRYGGETIIAGPRMEQMVKDLADKFEFRTDLILASPTKPAATEETDADRI